MELPKKLSKLNAFDFRRIAHERPPTNDPALQFACDHIYFKTQLPEFEDLVAFSCWQHSLVQSRGFAPKYVDYVNRISDTRYSDPMDVDYLMKLLEHPEPPHIPLGEHRGFGYRLKPCSSDIQTMLTPLKGQRGGVRSILPQMFIGLNLAADASSAESEDVRRDSVLPTADVKEDTGIVLVQLGVLEYADYQQWAQRKEGLMPIDMVWQATNYVVAVQINKGNRSEDVWIICNYKPRPHIALGRPVPNKNDEKDYPDLLPSDKTHEKRRPAARIASAFKHLGDDAAIDFPDPGTKDVIGPFELVPVVLKSKGNEQVIVPQYRSVVKPSTTPTLNQNENEKPPQTQGRYQSVREVPTKVGLDGENQSLETTASEINVPEVKIQEFAE